MLYVTQDLLARGMTFSPRPVLGSLFGGRRDLTFGIYGRADEARKLLEDGLHRLGALGHLYGGDIDLQGNVDSRHIPARGIRLPFSPGLTSTKQNIPAFTYIVHCKPYKRVAPRLVPKEFQDKADT